MFSVVWNYDVFMQEKDEPFGSRKSRLFSTEPNDLIIEMNRNSHALGGIKPRDLIWLAFFQNRKLRVRNREVWDTVDVYDTLPFLIYILCDFKWISSRNDILDDGPYRLRLQTAQVCAEERYWASVWLHQCGGPSTRQNVSVKHFFLIVFNVKSIYVYNLIKSTAGIKVICLKSSRNSIKLLGLRPGDSCLEAITAITAIIISYYNQLLPGLWSDHVQEYVM